MTTPVPLVPIGGGMPAYTVPPRWSPPLLNSPLCGGDMTLEYEETWDQFNYWCEGVLTVGVGVVGFVGNVFSIMILSTR